METQFPDLGMHYVQPLTLGYTYPPLQKKKKKEREKMETQFPDFGMHYVQPLTLGYT